jgi:ribonuclease III
VSTLKSPKSRLQELTQHADGVRPEYRVLEVTGPDHLRTFRVAVVLEGREVGVGTGPSRRVAETSAAARAIETLTSEGSRTDAGPAPDEDRSEPPS